MFGPLPRILGWLPFSHRIAQTYELMSARRTIRRAGHQWLDDLDAARARPVSEADDPWFCGNATLSKEFIAHTSVRTNLEIGSGPMGHLASRPWMGRRIVIDPLIAEYRAYQLRQFGKTVWTADIGTYSSPAESVVDELVGSVDGSIICRNALDHTEDPLAVLSAISQYAAPGCYLLLWTDIWHLHGPTIGHRNITRSIAAMDALLSGLGFDIIQGGASIRPAGEFIEYGRVARKRAVT